MRTRWIRRRDRGTVPSPAAHWRVSTAIALDLALVWFCSCFRRRPSLLRRSNMTLFRTVLVSSGLILAFFSGAAEAQQNARAAGKMVTLQMPAIPDPARVTLDPKTTALMVLDYVEPICNAQPSCKDKMRSEE